jgi:hypothetical protein
VEHLEDHAAYIDGSDLPGGSDPALAVDLLLGTQGWRRFLYQDPLKKLLEDGTGSDSEDGTGSDSEDGTCSEGQKKVRIEGLIIFRASV